MDQSQLLAHCGTNKIGREELRLVPTPDGTESHHPLPHHSIVEALVETLAFRHIAVVRDEYAVSEDGMRMFGVLDLETSIEGCRFSIGIRNSNDKSMRLAMTVGYRVFVCDNMAFHGDFTPVLAKHTKHFNLIDAVSSWRRPHAAQFRADAHANHRLEAQLDIERRSETRHLPGVRRRSARSTETSRAASA